MVKYLQVLYPQNSIESIILPVHKGNRYNTAFQIVNMDEEYTKGLMSTGQKKRAAPYDLKLFAGSAYIIATREFVEWVRAWQSLLKQRSRNT